MVKSGISKLLNNPMTYLVGGLFIGGFLVFQDYSLSLAGGNSDENSDEKNSDKKKLKGLPVYVEGLTTSLSTAEVLDKPKGSLDLPKGEKEYTIRIPMSAITTSTEVNFTLKTYQEIPDNTELSSDNYKVRKMSFAFEKDLYFAHQNSSKEDIKVFDFLDSTINGVSEFASVNYEGGALETLVYSITFDPGSKNLTNLYVLEDDDDEISFMLTTGLKKDVNVIIYNDN
jgi:hypothetical protein